MRRLAFTAFILPLLGACGESSQTTSLPTFDNKHLAQGKQTWMQVCRNCHLNGIAGAPAIDDAPEWKRRLRDGKDKLYRSALDGIPDNDGWSMPPRGGKQHLSDLQVSQAVDYMLAAQAQIATEESP